MRARGRKDTDWGLEIRCGRKQRQKAEQIVSSVVAAQPINSRTMVVPGLMAEKVATKKHQPHCWLKSCGSPSHAPKLTKLTAAHIRSACGAVVHGEQVWHNKTDSRAMGVRRPGSVMKPRIVVAYLLVFAVEAERPQRVDSST